MKWSNIKKLYSLTPDFYWYEMKALTPLGLFEMRWIGEIKKGKMTNVNDITVTLDGNYFNTCENINEAKNNVREYLLDTRDELSKFCESFN